MQLALLVAKIVFLGAIDSLGVWTLVGLWLEGRFELLIMMVLALGAINYGLLSKKARPMRYMLPGVVFLLLMVLYPIIYNITLSFTNYGTGHLLSMEQAIEQFEDTYYEPEEPATYSYSVFENDDDELLFLLTDGSTGEQYVGREASLVPLGEADVEVTREGGSPVALDGYRILDRRQTVQTLNRIQDVEFQLGERLIRYETLTTFTVQVPQYQWLPDEGVLLDRRNEVRYRPVEGTFTSPTGETLSPGFRSQVGVENYRRILNNPQITGPFLRVLRWNFVWATLSVVTTFALGLFLAILLNDPTLRFRYLYRTLLVVPYAVPGFISVLVWRGLLNTDFGVINRILASVFGSGIPWFESVFWAKFAVIGVNLWLGFPYMMIICLGALQSIPPNLYSVAEIDGASRPRQFTSITLPLVLVATGPLLVGSFAFNFNNFTVIYLLTEGRPVIGGAETPAGATDILISYTYNLAFAGRGTEYGFAAAISVVIFLIIGTLSVINFRATRTFERTGETL